MRERPFDRYWRTRVTRSVDLSMEELAALRSMVADEVRSPRVSNPPQKTRDFALLGAMYALKFETPGRKS